MTATHPAPKSLGLAGEPARSRLLRRLPKWLLFAACLAPAGVALFDTFTGRLAAEPIKDLTHRTGTWGITLLTVTLAITPLRRLTGVNWFGSVRRMLGLFAYFYLALHFLIYLVLDHFFDWATIVEDIAKRPFVTVGFAALMALTPLALTSSAAAVRRLGKRWKHLHALIYPVALAAVVHFVWSQKADLRRPTIYAVVLAALLALRFLPLRGRRPKAA